MENNLVRDDPDRIILKRKIPFSLRVVIPYTVWFTLIIAFAIYSLIGHDRFEYLPYVLVPYIAWCIFALYDTLLFHFTWREAIGKVVNRNQFMYYDDGDECYRYFVAVEFVPGHRYLDEPIILKAEMNQRTYPSDDTKEDIRVFYARSKPQLAILGKEKLAPITKKKKRGVNLIWDILEKHEGRVLKIFFASMFALLGSVMYFVGVDLLANSTTFKYVHVGVLCVGIALFIVSFAFYAKDSLKRQE